METYEILKIIASVLLFVGGLSSLLQLTGWTEVDKIQDRKIKHGVPADQAARQAKSQRNSWLVFLVAFFLVGSVLMIIGYGIEFTVSS